MKKNTVKSVVVAVCLSLLLVLGLTACQSECDHTGGNASDATCTEKAVCKVCNTEYGEVDETNHKDENKDHVCDRNCGKTDLGAHADENKDHSCDYGCTVSIGEHTDGNRDHSCDYGCTVSIGEHSDSENDNDHVCDHGCEETFETCSGGTATCVSGKRCDVCNTEYDTVKNPDNHDLATVDENGVCGCGQTLSFTVTEDGVTANYTSLTDALNAWTEGTTLTLFKDLTNLTDYIKTYEKGLVLDLNGHTVSTASSDTAIWVDGGSKSELTIKDSKGEGRIVGMVYAVSGGSTFRLEGGSVEKVLANGDFYMSGGKVENSVYSNSPKTRIEISGGEIYGTQTAITGSFSELIISGSPKITSASYAIYNSINSKVVISGTPTIKGELAEFNLNNKIILNTQPADGAVWRAKISTSNIKDGIFAVPGEGITLDLSKFASALDGYELRKNAKGELLLCNHTEASAATNGDGTHNTTCNCGEEVYETNIPCTGGVATDTHKAYCEHCNAPYGDFNSEVHYDVVLADMTEEELVDAIVALLSQGKTEISILIDDRDNGRLFIPLMEAFNKVDLADGSIDLTLGGVKNVPSYAFFDDSEYSYENQINCFGDKLKSITLPDALKIGNNAFRNCSNLTKIRMPKVIEIGNFAFERCSKLETIELTAEGTITVGNDIFINSSTGMIKLVLNGDKTGEVTQNDDGSAIWTPKKITGGQTAITFGTITCA